MATAATGPVMLGVTEREARVLHALVSATQWFGPYTDEIVNLTEALERVTDSRGLRLTATERNTFVLEGED